MSKTMKEALLGSDVTMMETSQQGRGREERAEGMATRSKSRDVLSSMEARLTRVEEALSGYNTHLEEVDGRLDGLESEDVAIHDGMRMVLNQLKESHAKDLEELRGQFMAEVGRVRDVYERQLNSALVQLEEMRTDLAMCKRALAATPTTPVFVEARRVDVPRPKSFAGTRNAREVDNFLWGLEQYFGAMGIIDDDAKVQSASLYLTDTAMLWWRRRQEDIKKGLCTINSFEEFRRELKRQFYPENAEEEARGRLRRLRQEGSVRDYVKEFTNLVLEIPEMSDRDSLFYFMDGLQGWAKTELRRRGVQDLASAIAIAESLIDYSNQREPSKPKEKKENSSNGGGTRRHSPRREHFEAPSSPKSRDDIGKQKATNGGQFSNIKCFLCDGPHFTRDCPQRQAINALAAKIDSLEIEGKTKESEDEAQMGSMQLLNVIQAAPKAKAKGLLYVDAKINGKPTRTMIDSGASHNFVSVDEVQRLGLKVVDGGGSIKAVNSAAQRIRGVARGVKTTLGMWQGHLDFSVVPMDDYKVILGMEFLDKVKAIPISFANTLLIVDEDKTCIVSIYRATKQTTGVLSAIQLQEHYVDNKFSKKHSEQLKKDHNKSRKASRMKKKENKGLNKRAKYSIFWGPWRNEGVASLGGGGCHVTQHFP